MTVRRLEVDLIREKEKTAAVVDSATQDAAGYGTCARSVHLQMPCLRVSMAITRTDIVIKSADWCV